MKNMLGILLWVFLLTACSKDSRVVLPNGYELVYGNPNQIFISNIETQIVVIGPHIEGMYFSADMFLGYLSVPDYNDKFDVRGYFIFDTKNNIKISGLVEPEWRKILKKCGIPVSEKLDAFHVFRSKMRNNKYIKNAALNRTCSLVLKNGT